MFDFFSLWHINHLGLFNAKAIFEKDSSGNSLSPHSWERGEGINTFPKGISLKVKS